ncbi:hypothetical protein GYMLUDRAFT_198481 [Collybiopsis luxurians FD-317 M1]|uniref:Alkyl hydroperoxide reductase subunit C/ Thiol specific antioxidant domain-containing protein n=1 Tax=Collybiopsis luxurians FD-317 M1 TaxID=944289 RepID=A0A0D0C3F6_9AGAR|nr:hypothetical protein GYMLUDRAFT_198481 [Collybiopsis luxurians FD-317 M1]
MANIRPKVNTGAMVPNFEGNSFTGPLRFHQWMGESWSIVFSHPGSAFVTELTELARRLPDIEQRGIKVVGFSRSWQKESLHWKSLLQHYSKQPGSGKDVQIIADDQGRISSLFGMLPERNSKGVATIPNTAFLVDPKKTIRQVLAYPSSLSNGLNQFLRFVDDNSGPLEDIPTELFGLDANGRGKIYNGEVSISGGGAGATVGVVQSAVGVINNVKAAGGAAAIADASGGDSSSGGGASMVAGATDYIQHALTVMDSLADIGKVMPFVAPAFVIIKTIIAIEQRARDVDAKCTDLVQRVTFMLSHLPALKKINVTDSTRQVIDRMNDVLKKAAALIQTYRKQGAIARRLSVHNKDRFTNCAASLKDCTNDLMVSLQIHQSTQLDILTRPVPSDPEDVAAEKFVAAHGGMDAVKNNEELVKQFASEMKLSVDEKVMEQLNTNITEVLQQNQDRLEQSLNESVSASVVEGIRGLAAQMNESAKEQTFVCIQCDKEYHDSTNGEKSCSFHRAEYDSWNKSWGCCSTKNPCQAGKHRSAHHCDYPYGNFFAFARGITGYTDTTEQWVEIEDINFETSEKVTASVGRLRRWKSRGAAPESPTILIRVGRVSISTPYLFKTFNISELEVASKVVDITHQTVIFRTSHSKEEYGMAEWVSTPEGVIKGITIAVKAATSPKPFVRFLPIDITTAALSGDIKVLSEGGLRSFKPNAPYVLPEVRRVSATLHEKAPREVRKDFKTRTSPNLPVILKVVSDPPLACNPEFASFEHDNFAGTISVFNKHPASSQEPISISSVNAFYRFIGEETYTPVKSLDLVDGAALPVSIDPRQTWTLKFSLTVPRIEEEKKVGTKWWGRSYVARQRPLRVKLVFTDIEEEECSLVLDYVSPVVELSKADNDDLAYFSIEEPLTWKRYGVHVAPDSYGSKVSMKVGNWTLDEDQMKTIVYNALKTGESEVDIGVGQDNDEGQTTAWSWKAWALVDLSCRRLYAFKILITKDIVGTKGYACMGYVLCREYGEFYDEARPIKYAKEKVKFPELEPVASDTLLLDDKVDDFVPEVPKAAVAAAAAAASAVAPLVAGVSAGSSAQLVVPEEVSQRLASIDGSLSRLATSIEQLVDILKASR